MIKVFWIFIIFIISGCGNSIMKDYVSGSSLQKVSDDFYTKIKTIFSPQVKIKTIQLQAEKDINNKKAVKVILAITYDDELTKTIKKMTAKEFFAAKDKLKQDHPKMMTMVEWGISPGQVMPKQRLTGINYFKAKEGFIFANYETPGRIG